MTTKLIEWLQKFLGWILLGVTAVLSAIYFAIAYHLKDETLTFTTKAILSFISDIITNTIPSLIVVSASFLIFNNLRSYLENTRDTNLRYEIAHEVYEKIRPYFSNEWKTTDTFYKVDWRFYFSNHRNITISTHYFDSWISTNKTLIQDFFRANKNLTLIIPDSSNEIHMATIASRFNRSPDDIRKKIEHSKSKINGIKDKIPKGSLTIIESQNFHWCCYVLCDEDRLIISPYEGTVQGGIEAPTVSIDLTKNKTFYTWVTKELDHLKIPRSSKSS